MNRRDLLKGLGFGATAGTLGFLMRPDSAFAQAASDANKTTPNVAKGSALLKITKVRAILTAPQIHAFSQSLDQVPIIDPNPRHGEKIPLAPAQMQRFKERSAAKRVNRVAGAGCECAGQPK